MEKNIPTDNWQGLAKTVKEKLAYVFQHQIAPDVKLKVGPEEELLYCHQIILIMNSQIFETMLSERWRSGSDKVLSLPEIDPNVMKIILKFFYTDDLDIPMTGYGLDICVEILEMSSVYFIPSLKAKCTEYFEMVGFVNEENALKALEAARRLEDNELENIALRIIGRDTSRILKLTDFLSLSLENLCHLLNRYLSASELEIFEAVCTWADVQCGRLNLPTTPHNLRLVLKDALYLIRFPVMGPDVFATQVVKTGLFSLEERVEILTYFSMSQDERNKVEKLDHFNTKPRTPLKNFREIFTLKRFDGTGTESFDYSKNWRNLVFSANRPIAISSLGFYGADEAEAEEQEFEVSVNLYESGPREDWRTNKICGSVVDVIVRQDPSKDVFIVMFPDPVELEGDKDYVISFILKGPKTKVGNLIQSAVSMDCGSYGSIDFRFSEARYKNNRLQVPEINFSFCDI